MCIASAKEVIAITQVDQQAAADDLRALVAQVTDAFVELAHHYLPRLDHQTLENSWAEVRHRIRHYLLLRDDQVRQLRDQLGEASSLRSRLQAELNELCDQMDHAKCDLMSKTGNVKKVLRLDSSITACSNAIQRVDQEIERGIVQLEFAESDARRKLPDYEASSLFNYLQDRHYGTPHYSQSGIERRWDRWVAKLIDYGKLKSSFEHLTNTPGHLAELINQKRDRYKSLLIQLEEAQNQAIKQFGTDRQKHLLAKIDREIRSLKPRVDHARQHESKIQAELAELNSLDGPHYQHAIKVYEAFLRDLEPEILSVYAACTESPIDDEICARLRDIREAMDRTQIASAEHARTIADQERFVAVLLEVVALMQAYLRMTDANLILDDQFCFDDWLDDLQIHAKHQPLSSKRAWRQLRSAIQRSGASPDTDKRVMPLEAAFLAASSPDSDLIANAEEVAVEMDWHSAGDEIDNAAPGNEFRLLAECDHQANAACLTSMLDAAGIPWFIHDGWASGGTFGSEPPEDAPGSAFDQIHIMVRARQFKRAKNLVEKLDKY